MDQNTILALISLLSNQQPQIDSKSSLAATTAIQHGAHPDIVEAARQQLGAKEFIGWCESFVEKVTGIGWQGSSAVDAWNRNQNKVVGMNGIQPGDAVYFHDSKNADGHTGVYAGNGQFISATNSGVQQMDINQWLQQTGQKLLGYVPHAARQVGQGIQSVGQDVGSALGSILGKVQPQQNAPQRPITQEVANPTFVPPKKSVQTPTMPSVLPSAYTNQRSLL